MNTSLLNTFLIENWISSTDFEVEEIQIKDILLKKKKITQKVVSEIKQLRVEKEEIFNKNKRLLEKSHLFKSEEYEPGEYTVNGIEPWTIMNNDCLTCDWHWEITCPSCVWTGEEKCPKCKGKTYLEKTVIIKEQKKQICPSCQGSKNSNVKCSSCKGFWKIPYFENCSTCNWFWKIKKGVDGKTKKIIYENCPVCFWKKKVKKENKCLSCEGTGSKRIICTKCKGKGEVIDFTERKETQRVECSSCNKTGRITCRTCRGQQTLICPTCKGDRKTIQYQNNKFTLEVQNDYKIINNKNLENEAIATISLYKGEKLQYLYPLEKEKLKDASLKYNIKINEINVRRIEWKLYSFRKKDDKEGIRLKYYIFEAKENFFFDELPPKTKSEQRYSFIVRKIKKGFSYWKNIFTKISNKLNNKKTY